MRKLVFTADGYRFYDNAEIDRDVISKITFNDRGLSWLVQDGFVVFKWEDYKQTTAIAHQKIQDGYKAYLSNLIVS